MTEHSKTFGNRKTKWYNERNKYFSNTSTSKQLKVGLTNKKIGKEINSGIIKTSTYTVIEVMILKQKNDRYFVFYRKTVAT